uniref:Fibrous sheath-interacting protein 2 C-terminal domain-containing protein n=1 Tax=Castor canadensis TaxID=51338 RepID=A0A8C0ZSK0_CASCN
MVNKLIFSSSPKTDICDKCSDVHNVQNQGELYDTAMKLIDSLLKEFSDAQIRVFRPDKETEYLSHSSKESEVHEILPRYKEPTTNEASSSIKMKIMDKMPHTHKATKKASADKILSIDKVPEIDKTLVNKIVHSSICNILKECSSQESICENVNSNGENLARSLTTSVINEIFQHQLNLMFCDEVPASACLPLESKDVVKQVQKVAQTASKECQTSSPYTIMLPYKFLEDAVSALLSKIFPTIPNTNTTSKTSEDNLYTELEFLQMKLVSTVAAEISKDEDMIIQYVESLHPNDDEIIQLVVQSIYNNLLPQFGSQEIIQNCVISGCRLLSETIIDLVLREVAAHAHKLSCNIIEEVAVKFLSKLLSTFPRVRKGRTKSLEPEMKTITSKILNSFQEFISKSKIKLVQPAKESSTVPLADNETIEKVVNSVYTSVLKHSGSHTSIFKDLLGNSNALSDIIGFLMVKEISNSEFQPQVEEEVSNSELVLEAVKILEKVVKIIDELKSQEKSSPRKCSASDAQVVEEASALFLAKLPKLPSAASKDAKILSKPELGKIASQLTKSVSAEISRSNISLVASDPEEHPLNTENIELVSQPGALKDLYDTRGSHIAFPKKVASLIVDGISSVPLYQSLRKILSLSNCCQSGSNIENTEAATNKTVESKATLVKRAIAELDMASSKSLAEASASCQEKKSKSKVSD